MKWKWVHEGEWPVSDWSMALSSTLRLEAVDFSDVLPLPVRKMFSTVEEFNIKDSADEEKFTRRVTFCKYLCAWSESTAAAMDSFKLGLQHGVVCGRGHFAEACGFQTPTTEPDGILEVLRQDKRICTSEHTSLTSAAAALLLDELSKHAPEGACPVIFTPDGDYRVAKKVQCGKYSVTVVAVPGLRAAKATIVGMSDPRTISVGTLLGPFTADVHRPVEMPISLTETLNPTPPGGWPDEVPPKVLFWYGAPSIFVPSAWCVVEGTESFRM